MISPYLAKAKHWNKHFDFKKIYSQARASTKPVNTTAQVQDFRITMSMTLGTQCSICHCYRISQRNENQRSILLVNWRRPMNYPLPTHTWIISELGCQGDWPQTSTVSHIHHLEQQQSIDFVAWCEIGVALPILPWTMSPWNSFHSDSFRLSFSATLNASSTTTANGFDPMKCCS